MSVNQVKETNFLNPLKGLKRRVRPADIELFISSVTQGEYKVTSTEGWNTVNKSKVTVFHSKCGTEYQVTFANFKQGKRCPKCSRKAKRLSTEYIKEFTEKETQKEYKVVSIKNWSSARNSKIKFLHKTCGNTYEATFSNFKQGKRCPHCASKSSESKASQLLRKLLESMNVDFEVEKKFNSLRNPFTGCQLRYDFYIKKLNLLVEIDGEQHFFPVERFGGIKQFKKSKYNDYLKNRYAEINGFKLIRVPLVENNKKRRYEKVKKDIFSLLDYILRAL